MLCFFDGLFQEKTDGVETKKEEPLVDLSEPAPETPKIEETKEAANKEAVPSESKPTESEAKAVEEAKEEKKEVA